MAGEHELLLRKEPVLHLLLLPLLLLLQPPVLTADDQDSTSHRAPPVQVEAGVTGNLLLPLLAEHQLGRRPLKMARLALLPRKRTDSRPSRSQPEAPTGHQV